jgi:hypothetical protein
VVGWGARIRTWELILPFGYAHRDGIADLEGLTPSDSAALEKLLALVVTHDVVLAAGAVGGRHNARQAWVDVGARMRRMWR